MFKHNRLDFLIALYIFCIATAEFLGAKTFPLVKIFDYQLNASVAILVVPIIFSINDVITEVYGKERMRGIIRAGLIIIAMIMLYSVLATALPASSRFLETEPAYDSIFGKSARIAAASLTAFAISDFFDVFLFYRIRKRFGAKRLWLRNNLSNILSQFVDTTLFIFLAFYALEKSPAENIPFLFSIILPYWLLKCFMSVIETPFVYLGVKWLKGNKK